jgi:hypothetical protein
MRMIAHFVLTLSFYDSFSLLKTLEGAFGLRCLNHACDSGVEAMSDLCRRSSGPTPWMGRRCRNAGSALTQMG